MPEILSEIELSLWGCIALGDLGYFHFWEDGIFGGYCSVAFSKLGGLKLFRK